MTGRPGDRRGATWWSDALGGIVEFAIELAITVALALVTLIVAFVTLLVV